MKTKTDLSKCILLTAGIFTCLTLAGGIVLNKTVIARASGCDSHEGFHYKALAPDGTKAGHKEFYTCCKCHQAFLTKPVGIFLDAYESDMTGGVDSNHIAYIAPTYQTYGAFLGRGENNITDFDKYSYISFEADEYENDTIADLEAHGHKTFAYLNVGSIETYRDYYAQFEKYSFADYENWPDEKWIDVSKTEWQNYVINTLAKHFKQDKGCYGVYMDNVDIYSVWKEQKGNTGLSGIVTGLKNIIKGVNDLGLKVMTNGGAELYDDLIDDNDNAIFNSIWGYHQEEVFSLITDYDNDGFGTQDSEDKSYYQDIASKLKKKNKQVFFLEYTKSTSLINNIKTYCEAKGYYYYASSTVGLY